MIILKIFGGFQHSILRANLVLVDKKNRTFKILDFAVSGESRIEDKRKEKIDIIHIKV